MLLSSSGLMKCLGLALWASALKTIGASGQNVSESCFLLSWSTGNPLLPSFWSQLRTAVIIIGDSIVQFHVTSAVVSRSAQFCAWSQRPLSVTDLVLSPELRQICRCLRCSQPRMCRTLCAQAGPLEWHRLIHLVLQFGRHLVPSGTLDWFQDVFHTWDWWA